ncbi:MAG TPA: alpha/beta hydrolase, partial [Acidimicrobiales bacterium]|nr:alpha/beta hydrolase [Acidimicrobiales bacterium]
MKGSRRLAAPAAVVVLAALATACSSPPALVGRVRTAVYCGNGGTPQTLDVFEPTSAPSHPVPAVVDVHGGGWVLGDATLAASSVDGRVEAALVGQGWVFVSIDYRLAPAARWPAQIEDAKCAVRYLRANAASLHIDPGHIGAIGASAGGQLVSMLGLAGPEAGFDVGADLDQSSAVQAVVDEYGPSDMNAPNWAASPVAQQVSPEVFGVPVGQPSPVLTAASPVTYVGPGAPPFLVIQGDDDQVVPPAQSEELVQRLKAAGDQATLVMVANADHGLVPTGNRPIVPDIAALAQQTAAF